MIAANIVVLANCADFFSATYIALINATNTLNNEPIINIGICLYPASYLESTIIGNIYGIIAIIPIHIVENNTNITCIILLINCSLSLLLAFIAKASVHVILNILYIVTYAEENLFAAV